MFFLLVFMWAGQQPGQCRLPTEGWPVEIGLLELVTFANETIPCDLLVDAGINQSGFEASRFFLEGRWLAVPPEPHVLLWQQIAGPEITMASPGSLKTWFEAKLPGVYQFELQVMGDGWIAVDRVSYLVTANETVINGMEAHLLGSSLELPVQITPAPENPNRLYVVEQRGKIRIIENDQLQDQIFLDLDPDPKNPILWDCFECGVLGMTFDPDYASNRLFYISFTGRVLPEEDPESWDQQAITRVFVYRQNLEAGTFQRKLLLSIPQPFRNHHGGQMAFGPDGMFYISLGDSSPCGDPENRAQNMSLLLGKVLRLQTNGFAPLSVPADNPFVGVTNVRPEIWASGFRNPWRWSFDPLTGDIYWGDVGQDAWEEINWQPPGTPGENFGWRIKEGYECFSPRPGCGEPPDCPQVGITDPILAYPHALDRCAVIGGFVSRGSLFQHLEGTYLFGDFCNRNLMSLRQQNGKWEFQDIALSIPNGNLNGGLLTLAQTPEGIIYLATRNQLFRVFMVEADD